MCLEPKRTVIVTGAAKGIGLAIARAFVEQGDYVCFADLDRTAAIEASRQFGQSAKGYYVNVADERSVREFIEEVITDRGTIDVLVNNAGLQHIDKVEEFPTDKWRLLIDVILTGTFLMTKYTIPYMKEKKFGRIINISSVHGKLASPYKSAYVSAKHGVVGFSRAVALETAREGITVNTIMPGPVKTRMINDQLTRLAEEEDCSLDDVMKKYVLGRQPMNRFIEPEEIASIALYLGSNQAAAITGEEISVSGGI